jgi:CubicO group peptidase (beta-lactamase class C family)
MKAILLKSHFILLFIAFLMGFSTGQAQVFNENNLRIISEMMDKDLQSDLFSGVVMLAENGKIVFNKAYGYADRESKKAMSTGTEFRLASVTKLFTLVSIMQLYDEGKLSMDDNLGKFLDGFSSDISKKVTIRQLLTMSAGFRDYRQAKEYRKNPLAYRSVDDYLKVIKKEKLLFKPGSRFSYSNSGFVVLGAVIEKVSGKNYYAYVNEKIFSASNMTHSYFPNPAPDGNQALPYIKNSKGEYERVNELFPASPSSNAVSTAGDMLNFLSKVCTTNELMSDKSKILFFSQYAPNYSGNLDTLKSTTRKDFGWIGGLPGESTMVMYKIRNNIAFIVLSNFSDVGPEIFDGIISILRTGKYQELQQSPPGK